MLFNVSSVSSFKDFLWRIALLPHTLLQLIEDCLNLLTINLFWFRFAHMYLYWVEKTRIKYKLSKGK